MPRFLTASFICYLCLLFFGCSSAPRTATPIPPPWSYEKNAIDLHIKADPRLNLYNKTPHTLLLCIYHLRDPSSFKQLQDERDGLQKLLECGRFDSSVAYAKAIVVQPGQEIRESLDRPEGVKFLNVAAGYYNMHKDRITRSFPLSLAAVKQGEALVQTTQKLSVDLYLGPREIQQVLQK